MFIHKSAIVHPRAEVAADVEIGPFCVIDEHVRIGSGCRLFQNVYVTGWTHIEDQCELHPGVVVGHAPQDVKYQGARSYCRVGRGTIIREYTIVHRGTVPDSETAIGKECFLLGASHVGHNVRLGDQVTLIHGAILGGHVEVGHRTTIGGGSGVHQFVRIGELVMIAGQARVVQDVIPFAMVDPSGRIAGLNRIGLRRAGIGRDEIEDIREAYRILYAQGLPFRQAVEKLHGSVKTPAGQRLLAFLKQESKRSIAGRVRGASGAPGEADDD